MNHVDEAVAAFVRTLPPGLEGDSADWRFRLQPSANDAEILLDEMPTGVTGDTPEWRKAVREYLDGYYSGLTEP